LAVDNKKISNLTKINYQLVVNFSKKQTLHIGQENCFCSSVNSWAAGRSV